MTRHVLSRRSFLRLTAMLAGSTAVSSFISACGGAKTPEPLAEPAATSTPAVQTTRTLNVLSHAGGSEPGLRAMAKKFAAAKNGKVEVEITSTPLAQLNTKALAEFTAKSDAFDLLTLNDQWAGSWAPHLVPLEDLPGYSPDDTKHIIPALMDMGLWEDVYHGLPHRVGANILFYRKDLLEENNLEVPQTQDEYLEVAKALTGDGIYGCSIEASGAPWSTLDFLTLLWARGAREIDEDLKTPLLDDPVSIDTARFYTELFTKHKVVPPDALSYTYEHQVTAMQQGVVAMIIDYSARVGSMEDPTKSKVTGKLGYHLVPLGTGVTRKKGTEYMAGHCLVVNKYSEQPELAYEFAKFCTTPEAQLEMALEYANGPTVKDVFENPEYKKVVPAADIIMQALSTARSRPSIPVWNEMDIAIGEELGNIFVGNKTPEEAMKDCNDRWVALLAG